MHTKYAGHVRQTSVDVQERAPAWPDILSCRLNTLKMSVKGDKETIFAGHQLRICSTGDQNLWQSIEGLEDILSDSPEIIFARTASSQANELKLRISWEWHRKMVIM